MIGYFPRYVCLFSGRIPSAGVHAPRNFHAAPHSRASSPLTHHLRAFSDAEHSSFVLHVARVKGSHSHHPSDLGGAEPAAFYSSLAIHLLTGVAALLLEVRPLAETVLSNQVAIVYLRIVHTSSSRRSWCRSFTRRLAGDDASRPRSRTLVGRPVAANMHAFDMTSFLTASALCRAL